MTGPVTVVTGATRGIGRSLVERLAGQGHHVIAIARNRPETPLPAEFVSIDLADVEASRTGLREVAARHAVTNLVNNAGAPHPQWLADVTVEAFQASIDVNLRSALLCTQAFLPAMTAMGRGRIVNVSTRAVLGKEQRTSYGGAKAGLIGFTRTWALELAEKGITVNAVAPGVVMTELYQANNPTDAKSLRRVTDRVPMRRFGRPEEVAASIAFFLGDEAAYVTGQVLYVCGGTSVGTAPL
ncbi:SDR family oxidoreductase [Xanthobacter sp. DSM 24535]|uniref:SDR family oxidoreductase n=1 Tax=Roseixanthobacter psychrophilus TaxID=3119917 RepID=UPI0037286FA2